MVDQSAVFVVDLSAVDYKDLAADDCGVYGRHSSPSEAVHVQLDEDNKVWASRKFAKGSRQPRVIAHRAHTLSEGSIAGIV